MAQDKFDTVSTPVTDSSVKAYHTFNDMSFYKFPLANGTVAQSCPAALGFSFAGGTSDGPGFADFTQNQPDSENVSPFWKLVSGVLSTPTPEQVYKISSLLLSLVLISVIILTSLF